jgi:hypothetical protein
MAAYRVDLLTDDPEPVLQWIETHVPRACVVRAVAYKTVRGWYMKSVFSRRDHAEAFHRRWHPEAEDHSVPPWGERYGRPETTG